MKKIIPIATATLLSLSVVANAAPPPPEGAFFGGYAGIKLGHNSTSKNPSNAPIKGNPTVSRSFPSFELGYGIDANGFMLGINGFVDSHDQSSTLNDFGADIKLGLPIGNFMPYGKIGLIGTWPSTRLHQGAGLEYKFAPQWTIVGEWTYDQTTAFNANYKNNNLALGINYYFDTPPTFCPTPVTPPRPVVQTIIESPKAVVIAPAVVAPIPIILPAPTVVMIPKKLLTLKGTNFATNSAKLLPTAYSQLAEVISFAAGSDDALKVTGHTDSTGNESKNRTLSVNRASSVKAYLVSHGVSADRISIAGSASTEPLASNKTISGRAINRRVEITSSPLK